MTFKAAANRPSPNNRERKDKHLQERWHSFIVIAVLIVGCLLCFRYAGASKTPEIIVTSNAEQLVLYVRGMALFNPDIEKAIMAGSKVNISYTVLLYEERDYWFDRLMFESVFTNAIKYDTAKKIFLVSLAGQKEPVSFSEIEVAQAAMNEINNMPLASLQQINKAGVYYVKIKAKTHKERHPMFIDFFSLIASRGDLETDWYWYKLVF